MTLAFDTDIATDPTMIVAGEPMVGALKGTRPSGLADVEEFLSRHAILPFGEAEFRVYARIRVRLETSGDKIGPNDLIIHNTREFSRVPV